MVSEALAAADRIVESNCASAKGTVSTSADGTPWVPSGVLTGSPVKLCTGPATPEPTVPIDAGSGSEFDTEFDAGFSELGFDTGSSDVPAGFDELAAEVAGEQLDAGASVGGPVDAAASSGAAGSSSGATGTAVSRRMPLPIPGQTLPPLDRAVTLGLGALFAMVVWKLYERRTGFG
jgi:hypothetical protein